MRALLVFLLSTTAVAGTPERMELGRFHARAIYTRAESVGAPAVVMLPGSGTTGPEEVIPAAYSNSGADEYLLDAFASAFQKAGYATLQLGKPGVDYFANGAIPLYDLDLYSNLTWDQYQTHIDDAVQWLKEQPGVDPSRIFVMGHSEGTAAAADYALAHSDTRGVFLLGYAGEDFATTYSWQLVDREIDLFLKRDVDLDHDGIITAKEIASWPDSVTSAYIGGEGQPDRISFAELHRQLLERSQVPMPYYAAFPLTRAIFSRGPIHAKLAASKTQVYAFTGELDSLTPATQARALAEQCGLAHKSDCRVTIVPGVGHGFSPPKAPRAQAFYDATMGPVEPGFVSLLKDAAIEAARR